MADPLRDLDASSRIEELLLAGLDHYFSGQHELAISVWTRVLFLDRTHARARAYIERARGAIAERQREGDELLQTGVAAFKRGDTARARDLLTSAVERGAQPEEALALLDRIDRLAPSAPVADRASPPDRTARPGAVHVDERSAARTRPGTVTLVLALGTLAVGLAIGALVMIEWPSGVLRLGSIPAASPASSGAGARTPPEPLPLPSASDVSLARAAASYRSGRLRDALSALEAIGPGDPLRARADELRSTIQQKLLEAAHATGAPAAPGPPRR